MLVLEYATVICSCLPSLKIACDLYLCCRICNHVLYDLLVMDAMTIVILLDNF
jgi:hypothetical protein